MPVAHTLDFDGALRALQAMLGQRVTVDVSTRKPEALVATFTGELHRAQEVADDTIVFIVGEGRTGSGKFLLSPDRVERATLTASAVGIVMAHVHLIIHGGEFTALLEEQ